MVFCDSGQGRSADLDCHQRQSSIDERHSHEPHWILKRVATARTSLPHSGVDERVRNLATSRDTTWRVPRVEALLCTAASEERKAY